MHVEKFFSRVDLDTIEGAVREVEKQTSGEIVPYAVGSSDAYGNAVWKGATLGALLAALGAAGTYSLAGFWGAFLPLWVALPAAAGASLGYAATHFISPLRRWLIPKELLDHRVRQRATEAFVEQEIFKTRDRTGILIFLSLFERRVLVLADSGINAKVGQHEWDSIVGGIAAGIRSGNPGRALAEGIRGCGELLKRSGVEVRPEDRDELADRLRMKDE